MEKECSVCSYPLKDHDKVVAIMIAEFVLIDSDTSYAIEHPTKCVEIVHAECFDYSEYGDEKE